MRENKPQYVIQPPNIPMFLYKSSALALRELIEWANKEHKVRREYLIKHGYWKTLKFYEDNESPITILAEMSGFRRIASLISQRAWDKLSGRERVFIRRSYELRDLLLRS